MIAFLVSGMASGVGKTTVSLALMAAFRGLELVVQPFKCGPDFLDTGHHTAVCGRASCNLDSWMLTKEANRVLFEEASHGADVVIVEGMMGLFDGTAGVTEEGSSAEIAKWLGIPVVLVLDASKSARSIAAIVKGCEIFDPQLRYAGIVLNGVSSEHHHRILQDAIRSVTSIPVLGRIPKDPSLTIPERHLGLHTIEEDTGVGKRSRALVENARKFLDLDPLLALSQPEASRKNRSVALPQQPGIRVRIGVARDKAFSFYYEDNLDLLRAHGAEIIEFSPLSDPALPPDLDALYLGGGYPELYAESLSRNRALCDAVCLFAQSGRPVYAECGGMIYLGKSLTSSGETFPMAGLLPLEFEMTSGLVQFGYVEVTFTKDCLLGLKGETVRGHSFHHSQLRAGTPMPACYRLQYLLSGQSELEGFTYKNVLASYVHLHFRANPRLVPSMLDHACRCRVSGVSA